MQKHKRALKLKRVVSFLWKHKETILKLVLFIINALSRNDD